MEINRFIFTAQFKTEQVASHEPNTAMFFPKPAPSAMTPYLMYPFHECHLEVGLAR